MKKCIAIAVLFAATSVVFAQEKLPGKIVLRDLQGGFAGFTGTQWTIETSGKWEEATVFNRRLTPKRSGTLTKRELASLAAALKKYSAGTLKDEGKPTTNPKTVEVTVGKHEAKLTLKPGGELPKPDTKTNAGRFAGVVMAIKSAIPSKKKDK